jgi:hypothetical protein
LRHDSGEGVHFGSAFAARSPAEAQKTIEFLRLPVDP